MLWTGFKGKKSSFDPGLSWWLSPNLTIISNPRKMFLPISLDNWSDISLTGRAITNSLEWWVMLLISMQVWLVTCHQIDSAFLLWIRLFFLSLYFFVYLFTALAILFLQHIFFPSFYAPPPPLSISMHQSPCHPPRLFVSPISLSLSLYLLLFPYTVSMFLVLNNPLLLLSPLSLHLFLLPCFIFFSFLPLFPLKFSLVINFFHHFLL